jgi:RNA polymerase sigma-70 factor (ECF subfamily)
MTDLPNQEVIALLKQIASRSESAAKVLYQQYSRFLYAYVRHRLPDDAAAEEVTQDVFFSTFSKPDSFTGQSKFSTWLCALAKNKSVDWWRKYKGDISYEDIDENYLDDQMDPDWDFTEALETTQDHEALRHCVDRLPMEQREMVFWVYYQDESVGGAAKHGGCAEGTVKSRLFYARKQLRDCMSRWIAGGRYG